MDIPWKRWVAFLRWVVVLAVVLIVVMPAPVMAWLRYDVKIEEVGPSLGPGEDSSGLAFESHPQGTHYLITGYGHAGEFRVLDEDLGTVAVIEPPEDGYVIRGCAFSDWGVRVLVWGRATGDANDTVLLYDVDEGAYESDDLTNGTFPLVTIDQARPFASELVIMLAGRDGNGTSRVVFIEAMTGIVLNQVDVPGNRTVTHADQNGNHVPVLNAKGGLMVFETFNWSLTERIQALTSDPTVHEMHDGRFWTLATEDGTVIVEQHYGNGWTFRGDVGEGPVEGALYNERPGGGIFVVVAMPADGGGSTLEAWWTKSEGWQRFHTTSTEKAISFIHHVPGEWDMFLIGYEDGSVIQYSIDIQEVPPEPKGFWEMPWVVESMLVLVLVAVILATMWMRKRDDG